MYPSITFTFAKPEIIYENENESAGFKFLRCKSYTKTTQLKLIFTANRRYPRLRTIR